MKSTTFWSALFLLAILFTSCSDENLQDQNIPDDETPIQDYKPYKDELKFESIVEVIDTTKGYQTANSLFYSRPDGATADVQLFYDDTEELKKMVLFYTKPSSAGTSKEIHYFDKGARVVSRELFDNGKAFEERISYYNANDSVLYTKSRTAEYEEYIDQYSFQKIDNYYCDMATAIQVLNQEGHFATTFRGFVEEEPFLYLIVGEDDMEGYTSALVIQDIDQSIIKLKETELEHIGKPMKIEFERSGGAEGFEYQLLTSAQMGGETIKKAEQTAK